MDRFQYFLQFLKDPKVAAVGPTSSAVIKKVCETIPTDRDIDILELGPGNGVVTDELLKRITSGSRILALETNARFCQELEDRADPRLKVVEDRGERFREWMEKEGFDNFHTIVSGIPCTMLSDEARKGLVMDFERSLQEGGRVVLYQLSPLMKKYLRNSLELERTDIRRNGIAPMFVMRARRKCKKDPVEREQGPG